MEISIFGFTCRWIGVVIMLVSLQYGIVIQRAEILALQTDNATQWQQIRANKKDNQHMLDMFIEEFELDEEGIWQPKG